MVCEVTPKGLERVWEGSGEDFATFFEVWGKVWKLKIAVFLDCVFLLCVLVAGAFGGVSVEGKEGILENS